MNQTTTKKTVPLLIIGYCRRIKNQVVNDFLVAECCKGNQAGNDDNDNCNAHAVDSCGSKLNYYF